MRLGELRILDALQGQPKTLGASADAIEKSQPWTPELVRSLAERHLVTKDGVVALADTCEASLTADLLRTYDTEKTLVGKNEEILATLLDEPKTIEDLREELDFPDHEIYNKLRKLEAEGAINVDRSGTLNTYQAVTD